jgi:nucleotide-binding universal stress UspA family protein
VVVVGAGSTAHPGPSRPVVVGVDGSPGGLRAVDVGCDLATATRASLTVVSAWLPSLWSPSSAPSSDLRLGTPASRAASEVVHDAVARARTRHPTLEIAGVDLEGPAVAALVHQCSGAGLLVVGSEGHGGRRKALLGSVSRAVARIAPCPVVVIGPPTPCLPGEVASRLRFP